MACLAITGPALGAAISYDGTYSGERTLTNGTTPFYVGQDSVTIIIAGSTLKFTGGEFRERPMRFTPNQNGSFAGSFDYGGHVVDAWGKATGTTVDLDVLDYSNGCEHHWHVERTSS
jgi:hypothetical protein